MSSRSEWDWGTSIERPYSYDTQRTTVTVVTFAFTKTRVHRPQRHCNTGSMRGAKGASSSIGSRGQKCI